MSSSAPGALRTGGLRHPVAGRKGAQLGRPGDVRQAGGQLPLGPFTILVWPENLLPKLARRTGRLRRRPSAHRPRRRGQAFLCGRRGRCRAPSCPSGPRDPAGTRGPGASRALCAPGRRRRCDDRAEHAELDREVRDVQRPAAPAEVNPVDDAAAAEARGAEEPVGQVARRAAEHRGEAQGGGPATDAQREPGGDAGDREAARETSTGYPDAMPPLAPVLRTRRTENQPAAVTPAGGRRAPGTC